MDKITLTGPVTGGKFGRPFCAYFGDISKSGYVEEEYFAEGISKMYTPAGELTRDGKWTLEEDGRSFPFKTRILVRRPIDSEKFNGTLLVEWTNTSRGYEIAFCDSEDIYREGYAYAAVSAQPTGLEGYAGINQGLRYWDPERYSSLHIENDGVSYDIYTQCAEALRANESHIMGDLNVERMIAIGGSQSGGRVLSYTNGVQPITHTFDALMPMFYGGTGVDFDAELAHPGHAALRSGAPRKRHMFPALVREDTDVPVFVINSQSEVLFASLLAAQTNTDHIRFWEIAGASHAPVQESAQIAMISARDGMNNEVHRIETFQNSTVRWAPTLAAAVNHVTAWIKDGTLPPVMKRISIDPETKDYAKDAHGNVLGGVRLPELEVPVASYAASPSMRLGGYTIPFSREKLKELYPTHEDYVAKFTAAAQSACDAGVILPARVEEYKAMAEAAPVPDYPEIPAPKMPPML